MKYTHQAFSTAFVAAVLAVAASACSSDAPTAARAGVGTTPASGMTPNVPLNDHLSWGDRFTHLLVTTSARGAAVGADAGGTATTAANGPSRIVHGDTGDVTTVHRADGSIVVVVVPAESMTLIAPRDASDQAALDAAGPGSMLVVDATGVIGRAGTLYVAAGHELTELDAVAVPTTPAGTSTTVAVSGGTATAAAGSGSADGTVAAKIAAIAGVDHAAAVGAGLIAVTADPAVEVTAAIAQVAGVTGVSADVLLGYTSDPSQGSQWALQNTGNRDQAGGWPGVAGADIAAPDAWTVTTGAGVTVAVIDSGVELTHPDLAGRLWANPADPCGNGIDDDHNGFVDDCAGWDFGNNDNNATPDAGAPNAEHGTHVAGIIAAAANGVGTVGVAPDATIMPLKVANSYGGIGVAAVAAAINYATANGAKVINLSLATAPYTPRSSIAVIEAAVTNATAHGVVVVAGAGNNGIDLTNINVWPASLSLSNLGVITAGASTNTDDKASFSNSGSPVSVYAPGWWILSTILDGKWNFLSGTSMASPYVAGAAALVLASGQASAPADVRARLVATADQVGVGKRLNVAAAVGAQRPAVEAPTVTVSYSGTGSLLADTDATLTANVTTTATSGVTQLRLSVATNDGGRIGAVEGLSATFADASGPLGTSVTGGQGDFPVLALRDLDALHSTGAALRASLNLPAGEYALVTEMLDASGHNIGGAQVAYVSVGTASADGPATVPATTVGANPIVPAAPTVPAGDQTPPTTPASGSTGMPSAGAGEPAATMPGAGAPATTQAPVTATAPPAGAPSTTSVAPGVPLTTAPAGATPLTTSPNSTVTTSVGPVTTVRATPGSAPGVPVTTPVPAAPVTSPAATSGPTTTQSPVVTTPAPSPGADGTYVVQTMSPRSGSVCGGTTVTLTGVFPATVPLYVWFGSDGSIVQATRTTTGLLLAVPATRTGGVVDISVRFTLARTYTLTLANAFTYTPAVCEPTSGAPSVTVPGAVTATTRPAAVPVTTAPRGSGSGGSPVTVPASGPSNSPVGGGPVPTPVPAGPGSPVPGPTTPSVCSTASSVPDGNGTSAGEDTGTAESAVFGTRGGLRLRAVAAGGRLSSLSVAGWPSQGCRLPACPAAGI